MGEKGERFAGTIIKDTWTITGGREVGRAGGRGKGRKPYLNYNLKNYKN